MTDWPILHGSPEVRDRRFVRLVVQEAVRLGLIALPKPKPLPLDQANSRLEIVASVARSNRMSVAELRSSSMARRVVVARHQAILAMHQRGRWSLSQIAAAVGLSDHTSVLNVVSKSHAALERGTA